jgi:hypothetical protein
LRLALPQLKIENDASVDETRQSAGDLISIIEKSSGDASASDIPSELKERAAQFRESVLSLLPSIRALLNS